jgi:NAD(P)H-hydrate epimerase
LEHGCVILKKGPVDIISDGKRVIRNRLHNQGMTKGGSGDVLSGLVSALYCKNGALESAVAGAKVNGESGMMLKRIHGYNYSASDLADTLSRAYEGLRERKIIR